MPNRIIEESICSSEKIASLTLLEFKIWVHLITQVDDKGRGDARPAIIKGRAFPLNEEITQQQIALALNALQRKGCIRLYIVDGDPYFDFENWQNHQRIRNVKSKYPAFEERENTETYEFIVESHSETSSHNSPQIAAEENIPGDKEQSAKTLAADCRRLPQIAADCGELQKSAADCGEPPQTAAIRGPIQSNPIQSESNPNPNPNTNTNPREKQSAKALCQERVAPCGELSPAQAPPTRKRPEKRCYGEYNWVRLSEEEYGKLIKDLGVKETERCIRYIDESAQSSQNKNRWKDWNLVVRRCSREGWGKRDSPGGTAPKSSNQFLEMLKEGVF